MNKERRKKELNKMLSTGNAPVYGCAKTWEVAHLLRKDPKTIRYMTLDGRLENRSGAGEHMEITWKSIRPWLGL